MNNDNTIIWTEQTLIGPTPKVGETWIEKSNKRRWYIDKIDFDLGVLHIDTIRHDSTKVQRTAIDRDVVPFESFFSRFEPMHTIKFRTHEAIGPMVVNSSAIQKLGKFRV